MFSQIIFYNFTTNFYTKNSTECVRSIKDNVLAIRKNKCRLMSLVYSPPYHLIWQSKLCLIRLSSDSYLEDRTTLSVPELMEALDICFSSPSFTFQQTIYQQIFGTTVGSPLSPIIANMIMRKVEERANNSFHSPP